MISEQSNSASDRRGFFAGVLSIIIGGVVSIFPFAAGLAVFLDPIRRREKTGRGLIRVASLSSLPSDGSPKYFPVIASRRDAWNHYPSSPIGAVYLRRIPESEVQAFNVACPHAGCFVGYQKSQDHFLCPCHNSRFALNGHIDDKNSPSPRGMDELDVEIRNDEEIWVNFQTFQPGKEEKIPSA
ncbi:MAG TPA: Rieske (2Fe-2S) protein [Verrucomicrobiales bacterium]|nr:Rieske (2Fe-2S) protein [Verrucomicrobiales bacterium]HIL70572.1 Rieske (2Fe-2S) protein [Verrucomicrobiota bacterium]